MGHGREGRKVKVRKKTEPREEEEESNEIQEYSFKYKNKPNIKNNIAKKSQTRIEKKEKNL